MTVHHGRRSRQLAVGVLAGTGICFMHNMYVHIRKYILELMCEDNILAILCISLPITTVIADDS